MFTQSIDEIEKKNAKNIILVVGIRTHAYTEDCTHDLTYALDHSATL